jgi:cell division protein FtsB
MSAVAPLRRPAARATVRSTRAQSPASPRPRLVLVSQRGTTAGRLPFLVLIGALLIIGLVSVLLLHMFAAQDAFRATALQDQLNTLTASQQQLERTVELDSAPAALRARAAALGMVPTQVVAYHHLKDGRAIGVEEPIIAPVAPVTTTASTATKSNAGSTTSGSARSATAKTTATGKAAAGASGKTAPSSNSGANGKKSGKHHAATSTH